MDDDNSPTVTDLGKLLFFFISYISIRRKIGESIFEIVN